MKKILAVVLLAALALAVCPVNADDFEAAILPTKSVNLRDQFEGILPQREPNAAPMEMIVPNERFYLPIIFVNATVKNDEIRLKGKLTVTTPAGRKIESALPVEALSVKSNAGGLFLAPYGVALAFNEKYPLGVYNINLELMDINSGTVSRSSTKVELVRSVPALPDEEAFEALQQYYKNPCPENVIPAFRAYLKKVPAQKKREQDNFNPIPQLGLFYYALKDNPQLHKPFAGLVANLTDVQEQILGNLILYFISPETAALIPAEMKDWFDHQWKANPFEPKSAESGWELDLCWVEFLIRGNRAPVMRVVGALSLVHDSMKIEDFKKIAKPTKEDLRKAMNRAVVDAACWSLKSQAKEHPLVLYYVEAALQRGAVKDPFAGIMAAEAIGMEVRVEE